MSDETTDSADLCCDVARRAVYHARQGWFDDHGRRTLLDALDAVPREAVEQEAERCAREIDAVSQVQDMAVNAWRRRAERAEAERDELREKYGGLAGQAFANLHRAHRAEAERDALREQVNEAQLARIEAQNPGIDIERVRRERAEQGGS